MPLSHARNTTVSGAHRPALPYQSKLVNPRVRKLSGSWPVRWLLASPSLSRFVRLPSSGGT